MRRAAVVAAALATLVLASRIPFATHELWAWDSVLYARALEQGFHVDFDLAEQRPQPPGYILYIALASLFRALLADSNAALVAVSILGSALGAAALYLLARRFAGGGIAAVAALGYAFNPLVWTYSEVAYPYALLGFLSLALAAVFWEARRRGGRWPAAASLTLGLAAGFRQDLLLLLGALWLWMIWQRPLRERLLAALLVACGIVVWLVPTALLSDGLGGYLESILRQTDSVRATYSIQGQGLAALWSNLRFTVYALAWGLFGFGLLLVVLAGAPLLAWLRAGRRRRLPHLDGQRSFFLAWAVPGTLTYVAVHIGEWGYVLSVLPALYVLVAALLEGARERLPSRADAAWRPVAVALVLAPALVFLFSSERFSAAALARHDLALAARVAYVRASFPPERTVILAREDFLLVRHYLPEYGTWLYDPEPHASAAAKRKRATRTTAIVIFTEGLRPRQSLDVRYVEVAPNVHLAYVAIEPGAVLEFYGESYTVREPQ